MPKRECVEHFVEGRNAWKIGVIGFLSRLRGMVTLAVLTLASMSTPWWWPHDIPPRFEVPSHLFLVAVALTLGASTLGSFVYLRQRAQRSLRVKYDLHQISHFFRDQLAVHAALALDEDHHRRLLVDTVRSYVDETCSLWREYFRHLHSDNSIEVAIRLAILCEQGENAGHLVYRTIGRSNGLSIARADTSQDVLPGAGIGRYLLDKGNRGVLIYNDLHTAAEMGTYQLTENDHRYPDEIATMMVAPINGWDGHKPSMLGIFYVTSRNDGAFSAKHIDPMRFAADMIGSSLAGIYAVLRIGDRLPFTPRSA